MNKSIKIDAGSNTGGQSSVNGNIFVGKGSVIDGSLETVNGSIRVEEDVTLKDAETVNGTIRIASGSSADGRKQRQWFDSTWRKRQHYEAKSRW